MPVTFDPNFGLPHSYDLGEKGWNDTMTAGLKKLGAGMFLNVISATTTAQPTTPIAGDRYIVPVGATGTDWAGNDKTVAIYAYSVWAFYTPAKGWRCRCDDGLDYYFDGTDWDVVSASLDQTVDSATRVAVTPAEKAQIGDAVSFDGVDLESSAGDSCFSYCAIKKTNLMPYSNSLDSWSLTLCVAGENDEIIATAVADYHRIINNLTLEAGVYNLALKIKKGRGEFIRILLSSGNAQSVSVNLDDGSYSASASVSQVRVVQKQGYSLVLMKVNVDGGSGYLALTPASSLSSYNAYIGDGVTPDLYVSKIHLYPNVDDGKHCYAETTSSTVDIDSIFAKDENLEQYSEYEYYRNESGSLEPIENLGSVDPLDSYSNRVILSQSGFKKRADSIMKWETPSDDVVYYAGYKKDGQEVLYIKSSGTLSVASTAVITGITATKLLSVKGYGTSDDGLSQKPMGCADLDASLTLATGTVTVAAAANFYGSSNPYEIEVTFI